MMMIRIAYAGDDDDDDDSADDAADDELMGYATAFGIGSAPGNPWKISSLKRIAPNSGQKLC